ncbi:MAG TPA: acetaldehyde dehydrogenase (acetylating) [Symbiobacteriaceae bacterium]|jgi:acetaldehyde dehydrogenase (acetylating)
MPELDRDLASIQEARHLATLARQACTAMADFSQEQVDRIVANMARAAEANARPLAEMAVAESEIGVVEDKVVKNLFAARDVAEHMKGMKTVGVLRKLEVEQVIEIAAPVGVVLALVPTTNPTSTAIFKALIALKGRNSIIISPHPRAAKAIYRTAEILQAAAREAGAPDGAINCLTMPTLEATRELMGHKHVAMILATGGSDMVKAAYSSGKPAYGVGPGNVPAYIERSADIPAAVGCILASKTFDNGTICASEQSVITEHIIRERVRDEFRRQGAHFLTPEQKAKLEAVAITPKGSANPAIVGKSVATIAKMAGIDVPHGTRVLIADLDGVGKAYPLSVEKLSPILAFYTVNDWEEACQVSIDLLNYGGLGHSMVIHSRNEEVIMQFGLKKPVFRILVNTPSSQGAIGATTGLTPSLTLGCGTWGGNITSENVGPKHMINIKRLAYGIKPYAVSAPSPSPIKSAAVAASVTGLTGGAGAMSTADVEAIVAAVLQRMQAGRG